MTRVVTALIRLYQQAVSPFLPQGCRFTPTCSEYVLQSVGRHGVLKGGWRGLTRLLRCHPFASGGYDPADD